MQVCKVPIIICEGLSEVAYLTSLNRLLVRQEFSAFCKPVHAQSGYFSSVANAVREVRRGNRKSDIFVWVDKDIYVREKQCIDAYNNKKNNIPDFWFSWMNFEDFLMLHKDSAELREYVGQLEALNHFFSPLTASEHGRIFRQYFPNYVKGEIPFELDKNILDKLFNNLKATKVRCDFGEWLLDQLTSKAVHYRK